MLPQPDPALIALGLIAGAWMAFTWLVSGMMK
jgi:hypothetical protein